MELINQYDRTLVLELRSIPSDSDRWVVSAGCNIGDMLSERADVCMTVCVPDTLRSGNFKPGDWIRGTVTCSQYLTPQGDLVQECQLVSAQTIRAGRLGSLCSL